MLDDDVGAAPLGRSLDRLDDVFRAVIDLRVGLGARELLAVRGGHDRLRAECPRNRVGGHRHPAPDAPDQRPLALLELGLRHQHPVGSHEDERERGSLLEAHPFGDRVDVLLRYRDKLRMCPVHVLPVDGDHVTVVDARVDHDPLPRIEARPALDDAGAVGAEDPRLGSRWAAAANPEVDVVQGRGAEADQHLVRAGDRVRRIFVAEHLGPAVLVDPDRLHGADRNPLVFHHLSA